METRTERLERLIERTDRRLAKVQRENFARSQIFPLVVDVSAFVLADRKANLVVAKQVASEIRPLTLAGRCRNGAERDSGRIYHAVPGSHWKAVCGATYGRTSVGWSPHVGREVTCPKCLKRMAKAERTQAIP